VKNIRFSYDYFHKGASALAKWIEIRGNHSQHYSITSDCDIPPTRKDGTALNRKTWTQWSRAMRCNSGAVKALNWLKSSIRVLQEHVFGCKGSA